MRRELLLRPSFCLALALATALALSGCATTSTQTSTADGDGGGALKACTSQSDCGGDQYCRYALGACGGTGSCEPRPEICTKEFEPVCACDQNTYSNACGAASEGLSILSKGRCGT